MQFWALRIFTITMIALMVLVQCTGEQDTETVELTEAECRQDLDCWTKGLVSAAEELCEKPMQAKAGYRIEFTNWRKFTDVSWSDKQNGFVSFKGDNGKVGGTNVVYECIMHPALGVMGVAVKKGML